MIERTVIFAIGEESIKSSRRVVIFDEFATCDRTSRGYWAF
jgi:hypothetical protein